MSSGKRYFQLSNLKENKYAIESIIRFLYLISATFYISSTNLVGSVAGGMLFGITLGISNFSTLKNKYNFVIKYGIYLGLVVLGFSLFAYKSDHVFTKDMVAPDGHGLAGFFGVLLACFILASVDVNFGDKTLEEEEIDKLSEQAVEDLSTTLTVKRTTSKTWDFLAVGYTLIGILFYFSIWSPSALNTQNSAVGLVLATIRSEMDNSSLQANATLLTNWTPTIKQNSEKRFTAEVHVKSPIFSNSKLSGNYLNTIGARDALLENGGDIVYVENIITMQFTRSAMLGWTVQDDTNAKELASKLNLKSLQERYNSHSIETVEKPKSDKFMALYNLMEYYLYNGTFMKIVLALMLLVSTLIMFIQRSYRSFIGHTLFISIIVAQKFLLIIS